MVDSALTEAERRSVACWGEVEPKPPDDTFRQIAAGFRTTCGVTADKTIRCWGMMAR
jgi:hypothetical protein